MLLVAAYNLLISNAHSWNNNCYLGNVSYTLISSTIHSYNLAYAGSHSMRKKWKMLSNLVSHSLGKEAINAVHVRED